MSSDQETRWWGKPLDARRYHVFEGESPMARSLCGSWTLAYDGNDPEVDPEDDEFSAGDDCKECARKAGVLQEESA